MVGLVADRRAVRQRHDRRPERGSAGRALARGLLDRIGRVPNPEQFVKCSLVGVNPRGAGIFPHSGAFMEPGPDVFGVRQVGHHGEVDAAE